MSDIKINKFKFQVNSIQRVFSRNYLAEHPDPEMASIENIRKGDVLDLNIGYSSNLIIASLVAKYFNGFFDVKLYENESSDILKKPQTINVSNSLSILFGVNNLKALTSQVYNTRIFINYIVNHHVDTIFLDIKDATLSLEEHYSTLRVIESCCDFIYVDYKGNQPSEEGVCKSRYEKALKLNNYILDYTIDYSPELKRKILVNSRKSNSQAKANKIRLKDYKKKYGSDENSPLTSAAIYILFNRYFKFYEYEYDVAWPKMTDDLSVCFKVFLEEFMGENCLQCVDYWTDIEHRLVQALWQRYGDNCNEYLSAMKKWDKKNRFKSSFSYSIYEVEVTLFSEDLEWERMENKLSSNEFDAYVKDKYGDFYDSFISPETYQNNILKEYIEIDREQSHPFISKRYDKVLLPASDYDDLVGWALNMLNLCQIRFVDDIHACKAIVNLCQQWTKHALVLGKGNYRKLFKRMYWEERGENHFSIVRGLRVAFYFLKKIKEYKVAKEFIETILWLGFVDSDIKRKFTEMFEILNKEIPKTRLTPLVDVNNKLISSDSIFSNQFCLVHHSGDYLYPYRVQNKDTQKFTFRVSEKGSKTENILELEDESLLIKYVLQEKYSVRVATLNKNRTGLYKAFSRSIIKVIT